MIDHLLKTRQVTTEHTSSKVILKEAKAMEWNGPCNPSIYIRKNDKVILHIMIWNDLVITIILILLLKHTE